MENLVMGRDQFYLPLTGRQKFIFAAAIALTLIVLVLTIWLVQLSEGGADQNAIYEKGWIGMVVGRSGRSKGGSAYLDFEIERNRPRSIMLFLKFNTVFDSLQRGDSVEFIKNSDWAKIKRKSEASWRTVRKRR